MMYILCALCDDDHGAVNDYYVKNALKKLCHNRSQPIKTSVSPHNSILKHSREHCIGSALF